MWEKLVGDQSSKNKILSRFYGNIGSVLIFIALYKIQHRPNKLRDLRTVRLANQLI